MSNPLSCRSKHACFGGYTGFYSHQSAVCNGTMKFAVYVPPQAQTQPVPVLYFLSGLTCTDENFIAKAGAQRYAAEWGVMLVAPDTSPRDAGIAGEEDAWDFGTGAGFYVDATETPWNQHYRMYSYVVDELPQLIGANFPADMTRQSIFGHSMGGHGALICALKNPDRYRSVSAFAPIAAPMQCPWGQKAFRYYLGDDKKRWADYDASQLMKTTSDDRPFFSHPILIDQGTADSFLSDNQLLPHLFQSACEQVGQPLILRMQPDYDHGYYFISTFVGDHIRHHATVLIEP